MRRVEFYIILTADGMYADPEGGLDHYDPAEDEHRFANGLTRDAGDIVMGRAMYDVMEYWDTLDLDDPAVPDVEREYAEAWRSTPKHVLSRGRPALRANADLVEGDAVEAVRRLKEGDGAADRARGRCGGARDVLEGGPDRHLPVPDHPDGAGRGQGDVRGARRAPAHALDRDPDLLGRQRPAGVRTGRVATTCGLLTTTAPRPTLADHPGHFRGERVILGRAARAIVAVAVAVQLVGGLAPAALAAGPDKSDVALVLDFSASILKDAATRNRFGAALESIANRVDETSADLVAGDTTFSIVQFASKARDYPGCVDARADRLWAASLLAVALAGALYGVLGLLAGHVDRHFGTAATPPPYRAARSRPDDWWSMPPARSCSPSSWWRSGGLDRGAQRVAARAPPAGRVSPATLSSTPAATRCRRPTRWPPPASPW